MDISAADRRRRDQNDPDKYLTIAVLTWLAALLAIWIFCSGCGPLSVNEANRIPVIDTLGQDTIIISLSGSNDTHRYQPKRRIFYPGDDKERLIETK